MRIHPDKLSLKELGKLAAQLGGLPSGKPPTAEATAQIMVGPIGAWEAMRTPEAELIYGDRRTGRSTELYLRWLAPLAADEGHKDARPIVLIVPNQRELPMIESLTRFALPPTLRDSLDHTLFEQYRRLFALAAEDLEWGDRWRGMHFRGWIVDGWTRLKPRQRAYVLAQPVPVIAYSL